MKNQALLKLVELIEAGREFPDAHSACVAEFGLNDHEAGKLTEAYDEQEAEYWDKAADALAEIYPL